MMVKILLAQILMIDRTLLLISVFLFFMGLICSIPVVKKEIHFLLRYPLWIWNKLKIFLQKQPSFLQLFLLIFFFNSFSLLFNIVSGFGVILPFFFSFLIGMNVGIIGYNEGGLKALFGMFLAPHAIFELPAAWFSTTLGMQIGREILINPDNVEKIFQHSLNFYVQIIIPLLLIAGLIESALIRFFLKSLQHPASLSDKPLDTQQKNSKN